MNVDQDALCKLIEAVEGGVAKTADFDVVDVKMQFSNAVHAYSGSLDAAKALHEALLPGWMLPCIVSHVSNGTDGVTVELYQRAGSGEAIASHNVMARAWLIAILKAKLSETTIDTN